MLLLRLRNVRDKCVLSALANWNVPKPLILQTTLSVRMK
jgi:hypothetical protein